jgi:hypothetical protein
VGYAVRGGTDPYPPERVVTRSSGNVVYEIDGRPALVVFRSQLGPGMDGPPTGQWFGVWVSGTEPDEILRVVAVDESSRSVALDRPVPADTRIHLVRDGRQWLAAEARVAASAARHTIPLEGPASLALAVGGGVTGPDGRTTRRELAAVAEVLEAGTPLLAWTADRVVASGDEPGPDAPVVVLTLGETTVPLPTPVAALEARNTPGRAPRDDDSDELTADAPRKATPAPVSYTPSMPPPLPTRLTADFDRPSAARPAEFDRSSASRPAEFDRSSASRPA